MADEREARNPQSEEETGRGRGSADASPRPSPVPGPGTDGAEHGYDSMYAPEERRPDVDSYDVSPEDMPPSPAGANADIGGEAAASRRLAGLPDELRERPEHRPGEATPGREPILGYDGMSTNDVLGWIFDADPETDLLERIRDYEATTRRRDPILQECEERLRRLGS